MINVYLVGRLGNQLFTYAMAEALRQRRGGHEKIVCYCDQITNMNWEITLKNYNIPNVEFVHGVKRITAVRTGRSDDLGYILVTECAALLNSRIGYITSYAMSGFGTVVCTGCVSVADIIDKFVTERTALNNSCVNHAAP